MGKGSYGKVKLALDTLEENRQCALKILNKVKLSRVLLGKGKTAMESVRTEIAIMKRLEHPNVVRLYEVIDDPKADKLYIIMEYLKNGSLQSKCASKAFTILQIWKYFRDIVSGLHYLHEGVGVVHRDIKPENLLLDENDRVKISDFGVSMLVENGCDEI